MSGNSDLKGLGGWLILVGIGVIVSPLRLALEIGPLFYSLFTNGSFEYLTTPGTEAYHQLWWPLLMFELVFNVLMLIAAVGLIYLFFSKHYLFPKVYIAVALISLVFIPLDAWFGSFVITDEAMFDPETTKEFVRVLIGAAIWVPYMLVSERVKATFVEHLPGESQPQDTSEELQL